MPPKICKRIRIEIPIKELNVLAPYISVWLHVLAVERLVVEMVQFGHIGLSTRATATYEMERTH